MNWHGTILTEGENHNGGKQMAYKRKEVNGYVDGKKVAKNLIALALKENKMLNEVKAELKKHFPTIIFKVE